MLAIFKREQPIPKYNVKGFIDDPNVRIGTLVNNVNGIITYNSFSVTNNQTTLYNHKVKNRDFNVLRLSDKYSIPREYSKFIRVLNIYDTYAGTNIVVTTIPGMVFLKDTQWFGFTGDSLVDITDCLYRDRWINEFTNIEDMVPLTELIFPKKRKAKSNIIRLATNLKERRL